jgi:DNA-binding MarR family transcriptional regulator
LAAAKSNVKDTVSKKRPDIVEVWDRLIEVVDRQRDVTGEIARKLRLSRPHLNAIRSLLPRERVTMSVLADRCGCQNANLTPMVADLEARGLLVRHAEEHDRRVRTVSLTPKGERVREQIEEQMRTAPSPLTLIDDGTLARLDAELRKVLKLPG